MAQTDHPGLSHKQKAELWRRWKAGETLSDIGRALGKHPASVFGVVVARAGFAPAPRSRKYFPNGTDLSAYTQDNLDEVARGLDTKTRKMLCFQTPVDAFDRAVALTG